MPFLNYAASSLCFHCDQSKKISGNTKEDKMLRDFFFPSVFVPSVEIRCNNAVRIIAKRNIKMFTVEKERQLFIRFFFGHTT